MMEKVLSGSFSNNMLRPDMRGFNPSREINWARRNQSGPDFDV